MTTSPWVDVTAALGKGLRALRPGELLAPPDFAVDQAISAVEIGDPRMDQPLSPECHVPSLLAAGRMPTELSIQQIAALLEAMTCRLAHWWTGNSLQQTLFSVLYIRNQNDLAGHPLLAAATALVMSLVTVTRDIVDLSGVIVEEDISLAASCPEELGTTSDDACKTGTIVKTAFSLCEQSQDEAAPALLSRMSFLHYIHQALLQLLQSPQPQLDRARASLEMAATALRDVRSTAHTIDGVRVPGICPELYRTSYAMPPPPLAPLSSSEAQSRLGDAVAELAASCTVSNAGGLGGLLRLVGHLMSHCSMPICRGVLYLLLSPQPAPDQDEAASWVPTSKHYLQQLCLPREIVAAAPMLKLFLEQAHIAASNYLAAVCMNRPRMRRRLRKGFEDWDRLRQHAENADRSPELQAFFASKRSSWDLRANEPGPCTMWVIRLTCACMLEFLFLGFELQLYNTSEFAQLFWYCDYLLNIEINVSTQFMRARPKEYKSPSKKHRNKAVASPMLSSGELLSMKIEQFRLMLLELRRQLCFTTVRALVAAMRLGLLLVPEPAYGSAANRYLQRFESFQALSSPAYISFVDMQHAMNVSGLSPLELLEIPQPGLVEAIRLADEVARQANMQQFEVPGWELAEAAALGTVARRNLTACRLLQKNYERELQATAFQVSWDFAYHKHFPAMVLTRRD